MGLAYRHIQPIRGTKINRFSIVIPAAGMGLRMKSYGVKSLIDLSPSTNLINHQLNIIRQTFINCEIILVTGFEAEKLNNRTPHDIIKIENERYETTNVVKSIGIGLNAATSNGVLIVYGDLLFNDKALQIPLNESILVVDNGTMRVDEIGCRIENYYVNILSYDLSPKWAQILFLKGKELEMMRSLCCNKLNENLYGFEIINKIIEGGGKFRAYKPEGIKVNDLDTSKDLLTIKNIIT